MTPPSAIGADAAPSSVAETERSSPTTSRGAVFPVLSRPPLLFLSMRVDSRGREPVQRAHGTAHMPDASKRFCSPPTLHAWTRLVSDRAHSGRCLLQHVAVVCSVCRETLRYSRRLEK